MWESGTCTRQFRLRNQATSSPQRTPRNRASPLQVGNPTRREQVAVNMQVARSNFTSRTWLKNARTCPHSFVPLAVRAYLPATVICTTGCTSLRCARTSEISSRGIRRREGRRGRACYDLALHRLLQGRGAYRIRASTVSPTVSSSDEVKSRPWQQATWLIRKRTRLW